ncbi:hypothetical protein J2W22_003148 [Sphingomonas kyeonggiensis]|uniref:hypothetical protein n=1 Tax=Sphingomonas kyeonggiensis TaxID=1268553 RepID=UPI002783E58C|nr:hypothetical protein [Sphingomonas kyeonggiensis]MDQ0251084.1 hypothetical protein [Sphingomonas kyeonggiensis]
MRRALPMALLATTMFAGPAFAQSMPSDVADLVGARGAGGETQLQARGYSFVTVNTVGTTKWSLWWSDRQRQCIQVATSDGRYSQIQRVPEQNCRPGAPSPADAGPPPSRPADTGTDRGDRFGPSITLVCFGGGSTPAARYQSGYVYNSRSHRFEPQYGTTLGRDGFASDLQIEIWHGRGRIRPEGKLVSPIHSGGDNGWWDIQNLVVTADRITGEYRMSGLNKPRFEIDRRSGIIRIRAATSFTGRCDAGDWRGGGGF